MIFVRLGDYIAVARTTGPGHNLLRLGVCEGRQGKPVCERLSPHAEGEGDVLCESLIMSSVLGGVAAANQRLGTLYAVTSIGYVGNDTGPENLYGQLAARLIEHLHAGGAFSEGV